MTNGALALGGWRGRPHGEDWAGDTDFPAALTLHLAANTGGRTAVWPADAVCRTAVWAADAVCRTVV